MGSWYEALYKRQNKPPLELEYFKLLNNNIIEYDNSNKMKYE